MGNIFTPFFEKTPCLSRLGMNHAINLFHRTISRKYTLLKSVYFLIVREEGSCILKTTMKKQEYWIGAHTKYRLKYHIVFVPKYRKRILRGELVQTLKTLFYQACEDSQRMNDFHNTKNSSRVGRVFMVRQSLVRWLLRRVCMSAPRRDDSKVHR